MNLNIVRLWEKEEFDRYISIEPASKKRQWMTETDAEYAYRCLPLNIANQHGWAVYLKSDIMFSWDGGISKDSIKIHQDNTKLAHSHFGHGILTFNLPFLIRLDPNHNLYITGAPNHHIPYMHPCTGIFEADWAPYSFTMNLRITEKNRYIAFSKKDPICFFFPVRRKLVDDTVATFTDLKNQEPEYKEMYEKFNSNRIEFVPGEDNDGWQKHYFKGQYADGSKCPYGTNHQTKIKLDKFK